MKNIMIFALAVITATLFAAFPAVSFASDMGQKADVHQMKPVSAIANNSTTPAWVTKTMDASPLSKTNGFPGTYQQMEQTLNQSPLSKTNGFPGTHNQMEHTLNGSPIAHEFN